MVGNSTRTVAFNSSTIFMTNHVKSNKCWGSFACGMKTCIIVYLSDELRPLFGWGDKNRNLLTSLAWNWRLIDNRSIDKWEERKNRPWEKKVTKSAASEKRRRKKTSQRRIRMKKKKTNTHRHTHTYNRTGNIQALSRCRLQPLRGWNRITNKNGMNEKNIQFPSAGSRLLI